MDTLPLEILDLIAVREPADYNAFIRAVPRYARADTIGRRFSAMSAMGYDYRADDSVSYKWLFRGKYHSLIGPAFVTVFGTYTTRSWYRHGKLHRDVGPAYESDGVVRYYTNDMFHRDGGPSDIYADGSRVWYRNHMLHRDDGPAVVYTDSIHYYRDDAPYRTGYPYRLRDNGTVEYRPKGSSARGIKEIFVIGTIVFDNGLVIRYDGRMKMRDWEWYPERLYMCALIFFCPRPRVEN